MTPYSLDDQIVLALRRISQAIDVWSRYLWQDYGLTSPQLATLRAILSGENASPATLATALHLSQPTMTGILGRLEQRGLIRREPSLTDRRSVLAIATEEGRALAEKAPPLLRDRFRSELEKTPEWQQTEILAVLQRVAAMMNAPEVADSPFLCSDDQESRKAVQRAITKPRRQGQRNSEKIPQKNSGPVQPGKKKRATSHKTNTV